MWVRLGVGERVSVGVSAQTDRHEGAQPRVLEDTCGVMAQVGRGAGSEDGGGKEKGGDKRRWCLGEK